MTEDEALALAFERAAGFCECIGGGCPALTHRPGVNRCSAALRTRDSTSFFTVARFADRADPESIYAICTACAGSPRRSGQRIATTSAAPSASEASEDG